MNNDLIEWAAMAYGFQVKGWVGNKLSYHDPITEHTGLGDWNPIIDDGDAIRLANFLSIDVLHNWESVTAQWELGKFCREKCTDETRNAATRRAIVRAAAAIGLTYDERLGTNNTREATPTSEASFEDALETAFWVFDAKYKGYGQFKNIAVSERDAFKAVVRNLLIDVSSTTLNVEQDAKRYRHIRDNHLLVNEDGLYELRFSVSADITSQQMGAAYVDSKVDADIVLHQNMEESSNVAV